jgi:hypothetical protein
MDQPDVLWAQYRGLRDTIRSLQGRPQRRNPAMGRAVLEQQHSQQRPPRPLLGEVGGFRKQGPCCLTVTPRVTVGAQYPHCHIPGVIPGIVRDVATDSRCAGVVRGHQVMG